MVCFTPFNQRRVRCVGKNIRGTNKEKVRKFDYVSHESVHTITYYDFAFLAKLRIASSSNREITWKIREIFRRSNGEHGLPR